MTPLTPLIKSLGNNNSLFLAPRDHAGPGQTPDPGGGAWGRVRGQPVGHKEKPRESEGQREHFLGLIFGGTDAQSSRKVGYNGRTPSTWFLTKMTLTNQVSHHFPCCGPGHPCCYCPLTGFSPHILTEMEATCLFLFAATRKMKPFHFRRNEMSPAEYRELLNSSCFFASESHTLESECNRLALDQAGLLTCQSKGQIRDMHSLALQSATKHWCRIAWRSPMISHQKASASHRLHLSLTGLPWFDFFWLCSNRVWARHTKLPF